MKNSKYPRDLKIEALKLSDDIGAKAAAEKLDVPYGTLVKWRRSANRPALEAYSESLREKEDLEYLQQEVRELKQTNAILLDTIRCLSAARA